MNLNKKSKLRYKGFALIVSLILTTNIFGSNSVIAQQQQLAEGVTSIVNDEAITSFDVRQRTRFLLVTGGIETPTKEIIEQLYQQALNSLINEKLQIQEARKFKQVMSDAEVDRVLERQARQNGATLDQFFKDLNEAGISLKSYRDKTRAEVLWQKIVNGRFGSKVKIAPERINENLSRVQESINKPQYQVSEIFIEVGGPNEAQQALTGAQTLVQQIRAGAPFARVAQQFSFAPSAAAGGDLGWVVEGELKPEVAKTIETIEVGTISDPIPVQGGFMIIGVKNKRPPSLPSITFNLREISKSHGNASEANIKEADKSLQFAKGAIRSGCKDLDKLASRSGLEYTDLGEVAENDLADPYKSSLNGLRKNGVSNIFHAENSSRIMVVCERMVSGDDIPTAEQIKDSLFDQELSLIARRYLRDIRREASIVTR